MNKFNLSLNAEQINVIFVALGKLPFESVFGLINELNAQLGPQASNNETNSVSNFDFSSEEK
jgi:hypothetical protein